MAAASSSSTVVIKVKYGDALRRFNTRVVDEKLDLSMDGLRAKILSLFSFSPETDLTLTYIDEDGDVVALVDDDDLRDVVKQSLNPLRITVNLNSGKSSQQFSYASGSSTPMKSPRVQRTHNNSDLSEVLREAFLKFSTDLASQSFSAPGTTERAPTPDLNAGLSQVLRTVQEPLREKLVKLSTDVASKSPASLSGVPELVDCLAKVSLSYLNQLSDSQSKVQPDTQGGVSGSSTVATDTKDLEQSKVDVAAVQVQALEEQSLKSNASLKGPQPEATMKKKEVKIGNVNLSSKAVGSNDVSPAVDSMTMSVCKENLSKAADTGVESHTTTHLTQLANDDRKLGESSSTSFDLPCAPNNIPTGTISAPEPVKRDWSRYVYRSNPVTILDNGSQPAKPNFPPELPLSVPMGFMPAPQSQQFRRNIGQYDGSAPIFHLGVRCDGCGVYPITGPRFKSKVKLDYDLCKTCFSKMGNNKVYIRMDHPAVYHPNSSFGGLRNAYHKGAPTIPQSCSGFKVRPSGSKLDSRFIQDVNIIDGTVMAPLTPFTKIWRLRNNGTVVWPHKTQLVWIGGDRLNRVFSVELEVPEAGFPVDQELDIAVDFVAPQLPGRYVSYWRMASPSGQEFGQRIWVLIQVDASFKETRRDSHMGFNLNLLPVGSSEETGYDIMKEDPEPVVEDSCPQLDNSEKTSELAKPVAETQPTTNIEHENKFPINNSLLVGSGAQTSVPPANPSVSYPVIDPSYVEQVLSSVDPAVVDPLPAVEASSQASAVEFPGQEEMEEKLLRELGEMGFKEVGLNKEILRLNDYDLGRAMDDLCGVSEWDPILEELKEMGFADAGKNKMLLKKNNGSITRVVMDLIAGEED